MGLSKTEIFTKEQNQLALIAKIFAHPARIAILEHLFKVQACVCGDLVNEIGLAQPTVSQHLKEMKRLGVITGEVEGTSVCYCIDMKQWETLRTTFENFLKKGITDSTQCC